ncbi:MAG: hypothetical protein IPM92_08475 [Saprospiraceae bacterium]|nr:hypothetical protein [Saprospiraceae bacterium]
MEPTGTFLQDAYRQPEASEIHAEETNWLHQFRKSLSWIKPTAHESEQDFPNDLVAD